MSYIHVFCLFQALIRLTFTTQIVDIAVSLAKTRHSNISKSCTPIIFFIIKAVHSLLAFQSIPPQWWLWFFIGTTFLNSLFPNHNKGSFSQNKNPKCQKTKNKKKTTAQNLNINKTKLNEQKPRKIRGTKSVSSQI